VLIYATIFREKQHSKKEAGVSCFFWVALILMAANA